MRRDPQTTWKDGFPYDLLAEAGITPDSDATAILDASFELMARGRMTQEVRVAWDILRSADNRPFVDFFLYAIESAERGPESDSTGEDGLAFDR